MSLNRAQRQGLAWLAVASLSVLLLALLGPVLTPFLVAAVLGYALHPVVERLVQRRVPRVLAVLGVEALALLSLLAIALLIVPILLREIPALREQIPELLARAWAWAGPRLAAAGLPVDPDPAGLKRSVLDLLNANAEDWLLPLLRSAQLGGSVVLAWVGTAVLLPVVLFYLLMDWPQLLARSQAMLPPRYREAVLGFAAECDHVLGQYLRGQLLVMLALAVFYALALALTGLELALPVGVFTGLAVAIPYIGFGLGLALALLAGLLQFGPGGALAAVASVYAVGQLLESFVLTPRLVGERIGLHPLTVILALMAFGHVFGFVGVLVALPASAVGVVALRRLRRWYLESPLYGA